MRFATATVVDTWGSSPRAVGAVMGVREDGLICGSVSGGCVETAVIASALEALISGATVEVSFDRVADEDAWAVGLACGGAIRVFIDPLPSERDPEVWAQIVRAKRERMTVRLITNLNDGGRRIVDESAVIGPSEFVQTLTPPVRLLVFGAVHISTAIAKMAHDLEMETTIIDPRAVFTRDERFDAPGITLITAWPGEATIPLGIRPDDCGVVLSHDDKIDIPALELLLRSDIGYIGALGSKKTQAKRRESLLSRGFSEAELARIHGPIGLDIGALTPSEIALSILSQIVQVRRGKG